jgi:hypothetical protein
MKTADVVLEDVKELGDDESGVEMAAWTQVMVMNRQIS